MALKALSNVTQGGSAFPKLPSSLSRSSELTQTLPLDSEAKATIRVNIGVTAGGISVISRSATASITIGATASGETFTLHTGVASCQVNLSASAAGFNTSTQVPDETSNGNDMVLLNDPTFVTDAAVGTRSTDFDSASSQAGRIDNNFESTFQSPFSLSVWTKPDDGVLSGSNEYIFSAYSGNVSGVENWRWDLRQVGGKLRVSINNYTGSSTENTYIRETTNNVYSDGAQSTWTHVVATVNSSAVPTIYINGSAAALTTLTSDTLSLSNYDSTNDCVGIAGVLTSSSDTTPIYEYNGKLDDIALWSTELTSTQVSNLYNSGSGTNLEGSSNLAGWWKMGEHSVVPITYSGTASPSVTITTAASGDLLELHSGSATCSVNVTASASGNKITTHSGTASCQVNLSASASGTVSTPAWSNDYSINLDGTNDYIEADGFDAHSIIGTGALTLSVWFKRDTSTSDQALVYIGESGANHDYLYIDVRSDSRVRVTYREGSGGGFSVHPTDTTTNNTWHHLVTTRSGTTAKLYLDGTEIGSGTNAEVGANLGDSSSLTQFGAWRGGGVWYDGKVDEIAIWDVALSSADVTAIYNNGAPNDLTDSGSYNTDRSNDLQGYWRFEENTGTSIADSSGNSRTATLTNGPTFSTDTPLVNKYSILFDGSNDYLDIGSMSALASASSFSVSFWFKNNGNSSGNAFGGWGSSSHNNIGCNPNYSANTFYFVVRAGSAVGALAVSSLTTYAPSNTWNHFVCTFDGGDRKIFINGTQRASDTGVAPSTTSSSAGDNVAIGLRETYYAKGRIDEVALYSSALSQSEVTDIYNSGKPNDRSSDSDLLGYWRMEEGSGTTVADSSGNGNTATLTNGPTFSTDKP